MSASRQDHVAVRLANGRVLVAGGTDDGLVPLKTVEVYNPATGQWQANTSMGLPRAFAKATLLDDDRVLVVGDGAAGDAPLTAEIFDYDSGIWTTVGSLRSYRLGWGLTMLADDRVLVTGGLGPASTLASTEIFARNTTVDIAPVQFGPQVVGTQSGTGFAVVRNTGTAPLYLDDRFIGGDDPDDFGFGDDRCPEALGVGERCLSGVTFTPTEVGPREGRLRIAGNIDGDATAPLTGSGATPPPAGAQGPTGPAGPSITGPAGASGTPGETGSPGTAGPAGATGAQGPRGLGGVYRCKSRDSQGRKRRVCYLVIFQASGMTARATITRGRSIRRVRSRKLTSNTANVTLPRLVKGNRYRVTITLTKGKERYVIRRTIRG